MSLGASIAHGTNIQWFVSLLNCSLPKVRLFEKTFIELFGCSLQECLHVFCMFPPGCFKSCPDYKLSEYLILFLSFFILILFLDPILILLPLLFSSIYIYI